MSGLTALKDIKYKFGKDTSHVYYIPLASNSIKIEPRVTENFPGLPPQVVGWRLFVNIEKKGIKGGAKGKYVLPIRKKKGSKFIDMYEIPFDKRKFVPPQNEQGQASYPPLDPLLKYIEDNLSRMDYISTLDKIKDMQSKRLSSEKLKEIEDDEERLAKEIEDKDNNFTILSIDTTLSPSLVIPTSEGKPYINPTVSDIISLEDMSDIKLRIDKKKIDENKDEIERLLTEMYFEEKEGEMTTRSLIEIYSCIKNFKNHDVPEFAGMVLFGPAGTGKTHLVRQSIMEIFKLLDFNVHPCEIGDIFGSPYVGGLSSQLTDRVFTPAIEMIKDNSKPCFVFVDEGSELLRKGGSENDGGWRRQGIEAMKSFIDTNKYPGLVICINTNLAKEEFDEALTRTGRMEKIHIGLPGYMRCYALWDKLCNQKYLDNILSEGQIEMLARLCENKINVATIADTCEKFKTSHGHVWDGTSKNFVEIFAKIAFEKHEEIHNTRLSDLEKNSQKIAAGMSSVYLDLIEKEKIHFEAEVKAMKRILDPRLLSNKEEANRSLKRFMFFRNRIPKLYDLKYKPLLNSFLAQIMENIHTLYGGDENDGNNVKLLKKLIAYGQTLHNNGHVCDERKDLDIPIVFLTEQFELALKIRDDPGTITPFTDNNVRQIVGHIRALPETFGDVDNPGNPYGGGPVGGQGSGGGGPGGVRAGDSDFARQVLGNRAFTTGNVQDPSQQVAQEPRSALDNIVGKK